jgi:hypothetical protein
VSRDFFASGFFMYRFPTAPEYSISIVSNFFENSQRYLQVKVHQDANFSTSFASVVDIGSKVATGVNDASGKLPPVSTTLAANLPTVSMILLVTLSCEYLHKFSKNFKWPYRYSQGLWGN